jgi:hypothetical protein
MGDVPDLLRLFNAYRVRYLVIGWHALRFHGYTPRRPARDFDLFVDSACDLVPALADFGVPDLPVFADESVLRLSTCPRIDVTNVVECLSFESAWVNRIASRFDGVPVHVLGLADLLANKLGSHRCKDHLDGLHLLTCHRSRPSSCSRGSLSSWSGPSVSGSSGAGKSRPSSQSM